MEKQCKRACRWHCFWTNQLSGRLEKQQNMSTRIQWFEECMLAEWKTRFRRHSC